MQKQLMKRSPRKDPFIAQFLASIPPEIASSFTDEQLTALKGAFGKRGWNRHPVDIRMSVPFPRPGFYIVLLGGRERRSRQRRQGDRNLHGLWTWRNSAVIVSFTLAIMSAGIGGVYTVEKSLDLLSKKRPFHPTAIPWISDAETCEKTDRVWRDSECLDFEHSPDF
ncbi:hypothetical protein [Phormidium sp. CCY1219]|uniref:hypothetical protein n=1 Tax=Phormidium sp. CCY1219 TaxID=2886104 RepID=UPI002D1EDB93|nr:hypothetical protein [Phormidium sp. CCY1219]MEB3827302.1 hypothetical protein [Phormidium sp. CCY1219]